MRDLKPAVDRVMEDKRLIAYVRAFVESEFPDDNAAIPTERIRELVYRVICAAER